MIDQERQSDAARAAGVCHTFEECAQMYRELPAELKAPALQMLAQELAPVKAEIEKAFAADKEHWIGAYHFHFGMRVRNLLRDKGYGEEYFKVHNLDDIYVALIEEALGLQ